MTVMLQRVRYWLLARSGKADGVGQVIQGPRMYAGPLGPYRCWRVRMDDGGADWFAETHIEAELPNGAGVRS